MVKKECFIALLTSLSLHATVLLAGEFTASVSSTQVRANEPFSLSLTLKDSSSKETPTISALNPHFFIHSQQKFASTTILNGKVSSNITWKLSLTPKTEGNLQIPSITLSTKEGLLSTQPIALNVVKASTVPSSKETSGLNLVSRVSNASPYKNEPLVYTALLTSKLPLYNVQAQKLELDDAIVELLGEPRLEEKTVGGSVLYVVEFHYLLTPLKPGPLTIPPITVQGAVPQKRKERSGSFFYDDLDLFTLMQGFDSLKSFTLTTEKIPLTIQAAIPEVSPWLPAKALTLEEQWPNNQTLRVGEPFSRGVWIQAEGLKSGQLPHLYDLQSRDATFKVYADKPKEQEKMLHGVMHSTRQEHYTLIPQKAGIGVLPEIAIDWWDSVKKEKRTAILPARTVDILPAAVATTDSSVSKEPDKAPEAIATETFVAPEPPPYLLYGIIGALAFLLTAALLWGFILHRRIAGFTQDAGKKPVEPPTSGRKPPKTLLPPSIVSQKEKSDRLPDLNPT